MHGDMRSIQFLISFLPPTKGRSHSHSRPPPSPRVLLPPCPPFPRFLILFVHFPSIPFLAYHHNTNTILQGLSPLLSPYSSFLPPSLPHSSTLLLLLLLLLLLEDEELIQLSQFVSVL